MFIMLDKLVYNRTPCSLHACAEGALGKVYELCQVGGNYIPVYSSPLYKFTSSFPTAYRCEINFLFEINCKFFIPPLISE